MIALTGIFGFYLFELKFLLHEKRTEPELEVERVSYACSGNCISFFLDANILLGVKVIKRLTVLKYLITSKLEL